MSLPTPFYKDDWCTIYCADNKDILPYLESVDLVITSPPYGNLRDYEKFEFDFKKTASGIFKCLKDGSCLVWVVGDSVINGSETCESFMQAIYFKTIGLNLH